MGNDIEFITKPPHKHSSYPLKTMLAEKVAVDLEITNLTHHVIEPVKHAEDEFVFFTPKPDRVIHLILNLKQFNTCFISSF